MGIIKATALYAFLCIIFNWIYVSRLLLMNGADPTCKDKKSQTPYDHSMDKQTRNVFRRFMGEFPEQYDYSKVSMQYRLDLI